MGGSRAHREVPETRPLVSERVDDRPVLLAHRARLGWQPLVDEHCSTHGHGVGVSLGWVSVLGVPPLLSEGDHRLNHVALWADSGCTRGRVHRAAGTPRGCPRRPSGHGAGGLESRDARERG